MTEGGFLAPRRPQPIQLGLVIAAHVAVIASLMMVAAPKVSPTVHRFFAYNVPDDPPPPPPVRQDRTPPKTATREHLTTPVPTVVIPQPTPTETVIALQPLPPIPAGPTVIPTPPAPTPTPAVEPPLVQASVDPRYADALQPPYPPDLIRQGIEGSATVRVLIGADGRVRDVQFVSADQQGFFAATERQARRAWRFRPATRGGVAVESWRTMTVHFVMK